MQITSWLSSIIHISFFLSNLFGLHIPLMVARIFGRNAMDQVLNLHCYFHMLNTQLLGSQFTIQLPEEHLNNSPLILVSNHQSMYDIPFIIWNFRSRNPKFISKRELAQWIPSISFALRNGGHILIDRKKAKASIQQIKEAAQEFEKNLGTISIFPEGTRSKNR